jgi:iron complex transport system substrate-binding protein
VVLAARPDLVLLYASGDNRPAARQLRRAGINVVGLKIDRIADFARATRLLGTLTGHQDRARRTADSVLATLDSVRKATAALPRPRVFWHIWDQPIITIGGGSYLDELLSVAGGENIYGDMSAASPPVTLEDIVRRDPDVVLAGPINAARLAADPRWQAVPAVASGKILVVDTTLVGRPSVMLGQAAAHLAGLLHPAVKR